MLKAFNPSHHILNIHATETILWLGNAYALHNPTNAILNRANILKWCLFSVVTNHTASSWEEQKITARNTFYPPGPKWGTCS